MGTIKEAVITLIMTSKIVLFSTISAANKAYNILQKMLDVAIDCNAITYNIRDEETFKWLVKDNYCGVGARERIYLYLKAIASRGDKRFVSKINS